MRPVSFRSLRMRSGIAPHIKFTGSSPFSSTVSSRRELVVNAMTEEAALTSMQKRVDRAAKGFRRVGVMSFWAQLTLTVVSSVIIVFAILYRTATQVSKEAGLYLTLFGLILGFLSTFWAFGYTRLAAKLRKGVNEPEKTPPRATVLKTLTSGIIINIIGMGATIFGLEATTGLLFAKSLSASFTMATPYAMNQANPVQALDIFVVQASTNTLLSHFIGLCFSLWLLRAITNAGDEPLRPAAPVVDESL